MNVRRRVEEVGARRGVDLVGAGFILVMAVQFGFVVVLGKIATRPGGMFRTTAKTRTEKGSGGFLNFCRGRGCSWRRT